MTLYDIEKLSEHNFELLNGIMLAEQDNENKEIKELERRAKR